MKYIIILFVAISLIGCATPKANHCPTAVIVVHPA